MFVWGQVCGWPVGTHQSEQAASLPVTLVHVIRSRLVFAPWQLPPHLKPASGLPSSLSFCFSPLCPIGTHHQYPSPQVHCQPSPHSAPLEPYTSKACQLNMSLIREGGACSQGVEGSFSRAIHHYWGITHTIGQLKKALRSCTHIHCWTSVFSNAQHILLLLNDQS